uniref:NADH-ubiquinone oxidoreductase chain 4L n=1 Tax=Typosyllis antoni TaxID=1898412 RepID=A0A1C9UZG1_9ANNE|nr:NADH dehydrogenase subunit 4L [Typosyllis antoni]AOR87158.1 NADH dehydrogenase subunit 4L [Typosyllis antoni]
MTIMFSLFSLFCTLKSFLMCLLNLEIMMLSIIMFTLISFYSLSNTEALNSLLILAFSACEASLGLACLVNMLRVKGNDNIKTFSMFNT